MLAYLFVLGHLLHYASFGHNSVMDYWHDVKDPSKKHHPLVSGRIGLDRAHRVIHTLLVFSCILLLTPMYLLGKYASLFFASLYIVFGHAYNDGLDHATKHSWIPITLCFTCLCASSYLLVGGFETRFALVATWAFLTILYQIAWEGNLKDVWNPVELYNPLKNRVVVVKDMIVDVNRLISLLFFTVRAVLNTVVLALLLIDVGVRVDSLALLVATCIVELYTVLKIHFTIAIKRDRLLSLFGLAEAFEFFRLISVLGLPGLPLIVYGLVYFVVANRVLWGTRFGPRV